MTHSHCGTDPPTGQSTPDAPPSLQVELKITESPAPGWSRLWAWLLAPPEQDDDSDGDDDEVRG